MKVDYKIVEVEKSTGYLDDTDLHMNTASMFTNQETVHCDCQPYKSIK